MIANADARRTSVLREIERRRSGLTSPLPGISNQVIAGEVVDVCRQRAYWSSPVRLRADRQRSCGGRGASPHEVHPSGRLVGFEAAGVTACFDVIGLGRMYSGSI